MNLTAFYISLLSSLSATSRIKDVLVLVTVLSLVCERYRNEVVMENYVDIIGKFFNFLYLFIIFLFTVSFSFLILVHDYFVVPLSTALLSACDG